MAIAGLIDMVADCRGLFSPCSNTGVGAGRSKPAGSFIATLFCTGSIYCLLFFTAKKLATGGQRPDLCSGLFVKPAAACGYRGRDI